MASKLPDGLLCDGNAEAHLMHGDATLQRLLRKSRSESYCAVDGGVPV
jgi:hypothetical protein